MKAISLPGEVSVSILPNTPYAFALAEAAHKQQKEVLLHLPMQAHNDDHDHEIPLRPDMSHHAFVKQLRQYIASVPYAQGINNHKGSLLTERHQAMSWLMTELRQWGDIYYLDSRTTPNSIAQQRAVELGIKSLHRNVFLDHEKDFASLETQFKRLLNKARSQGYAIAIGHPHPETLAFLQQRLATLPSEGIELVAAYKLVQQYSETPTWQASLSPSPKAAKN